MFRCLPPPTFSSLPSRTRNALCAVGFMGLRGIVKSIYYNFKLFPAHIAWKMPMFVSGKTQFYSTRKGAIEFTSDVRPGMLRIGVTHLDCSYPAPCFVKIEGKLIINGRGLHAFAPGCTLTVRETGVLEIGDNFAVGHFGRFLIGGHSVIGDNNMHSWENLYLDTDGHPMYDENGKQINAPRGFVIGDNVWVGAKCTILKGVKIANGCILATGNTITKDLDTQSAVYVGHRKLRENVSWKSRRI